MKYRDKVEIRRDLMIAISRNVSTLTRLMYISELSGTQGKTYLTELIDQGLVNRLDNNYYLTGKGWEYLNILNMLRAMCPPEPTVKIPH
jgi:predicted transcriptional regulator